MNAEATIAHLNFLGHNLAANTLVVRADEVRVGDLISSSYSGRVVVTAVETRGDTTTIRGHLAHNENHQVQQADPRATGVAVLTRGATQDNTTPAYTKTDLPPAGPTGPHRTFAHTTVAERHADGSADVTYPSGKRVHISDFRAWFAAVVSKNEAPYRLDAVWTISPSNETTAQ